MRNLSFEVKTVGQRSSSDTNKSFPFNLMHRQVSVLQKKTEKRAENRCKKLLNHQLLPISRV